MQISSSRTSSSAHAIAQAADGTTHLTKRTAQTNPLSAPFCISVIFSLLSARHDNLFPGGVPNRLSGLHYTYESVPYHSICRRNFPVHILLFPVSCRLITLSRGVYRFRSIASVSSALDTAPRIRSTSFPSLKITSVGIDII